MADETNIVWGPVENLRALLAASAAFQTLVGAANATEAKAHIYSPALPQSAIAAARPFALLSTGQRWRADRIAETAHRLTGSLMWLLEADVPEAHAGKTAAALEAAENWFCVLVGDILYEMLVLSGTPGYLPLVNVGLLDGPARSGLLNKDADGDYYQVVYELDWGP